MDFELGIHSVCKSKDVILKLIKIDTTVLSLGNKLNPDQLIKAE